MDTYFTADTHFFHANRVKYREDCASVEEMNDILVSNWNSVIKPDDQVYFLGDFVFGSKANIDWGA